MLALRCKIISEVGQVNEEDSGLHIMDDGNGDIYKPETDRNSNWVSSNRGLW